MTNKHTPGPWSVAMNSTCSAAWPVVVANDDATDEQVDIAELGTSHIFNYAKFDASKVSAGFDERQELFTEHSEHDLQMANARLIAAAPELLSIVVRLVEHGLSTTLIKDARTVIAKATGVQP